MTDPKQIQKTANDRQAVYLKELRARQAALRPDISPEEAQRRRAKSLRNFKIFELVSIIVLTGVLVFLSHHIYQSFQNEDAYEAVFGNDATFNLTLMFWGAITLQASLMLFFGFRRNNADNLISEDNADHPFRGWRFTFFTPLLGTVILLPAILVGAFNDEDINTVGSFFLILAMSLVALLLSALVAAFILAPLAFLWSGVVGLITGDKTRSWRIVPGLFIAALTAFIIVGSMAVSADLPYPAGSFQALLAIFGIPGGYVINDEAFLWVARGIFAAIIAFCASLFITGRRPQEVTKASAK